MNPQQDASLDQLRRAVIQQLESLHRAGVRQIGKPSLCVPLGQQQPATSHTAVTSEVSEPPMTKPSRQNLQDDSSPSTSNDLAEAAANRSLEPCQHALAVLQREVASCLKCPELAETRTQTVFGVGHAQARLCFLGEAPGADEDRQGEPFVGRAGKLLTDIIEACTLKREEVYILNILKCRPPGNRNPLPDEVAACRGYLEKQLDIIQPEYICCLGAVAAQNLLETTQSIGKLRKRFHFYRGIKVLATYHPAYLLRNPSAKRDVWEDMQMLMHEMGIQLPDKSSNG